MAEQFQFAWGTSGPNLTDAVGQTILAADGADDATRAQIAVALMQFFFTNLNAPKSEYPQGPDAGGKILLGPGVELTADGITYQGETFYPNRRLDAVRREQTQNIVSRLVIDGFPAHAQRIADAFS